MALNVYLTFFHKFNQRDLKRLEWMYGICYYSIPFVLTLVYLSSIYLIGVKSRIRSSEYIGITVIIANAGLICGVGYR